MTTESFDTIVVGAGAMGSAAAYHLARDGRHVLLLEQFEIAHERGSSHGESRIFRYAYTNPAYARLAVQSKRLWRALEAESGAELLRDTGGLDLADTPYGYDAIRNVAGSLDALDQRWEELDARRLAARFPQWRVHEDARAIYSPDSGVLHATRCVQTMAAEAARHGATVRDQEPVREIRPDGSSVEVVTDTGRYRGRRLVVATGPWSGTMLRQVGLDLPLVVSKEQTVYFRPRANAESFQPGPFTIFIHHREDHVYGFPIMGIPGIKIAFHLSGVFVDPNQYDRQPMPEPIERLRAYLERHLPDAAGEPFNPTTCLYTITPTEDFIVDSVPGFPNIVVGAGFSGHGYKFAVGIGRALADLVQQGGTEMEIRHLGLDRYQKA